RTTDLSLFDDDQLRAAFGDLKFDESLMDATGFEPLEIADLLADPPSPLDAPEPQIDHASELQEKWRTAPGQLWTIGRHRLLVGDSTDEPQLERLLDGEIVGAVITDPPYSSGGQFRGDRAQATGTKYTTTGTLRNRPNFSGDNRDQRSWIAWCSAWLAKLLLHVEEGANLAVWSDWRQLPSLTDAIQGGGWVWRGVAGWDKTEAARPVLGRFRSQLEFVVWGSAGGLRDNKTDPPYPGTHRQAVKSAEKEHQTQKPLDVVVWSLSMARGIVVDPFLGAGTTMVACEKLGLRCFGAEISPPYAAVCLERLAGAGLTPILADKPARRKRAKQSSPVA
ncbi:MAG TPA: DNA methyltransferase, partial [Pirellulales bacterium]|nr:DNA methyltransferase [Pirellulales bacterium]